MKKIIALLLVTALLTSLLSGCCMTNSLLDKIIMSEEILGNILEESTAEKVDGSDISALQYALDQDMIDLFYQRLEEAEELSVAGDDLAAAEEMIALLDEVYMELVDQYQISYVQYCLDQSDEEMKQRYLDSVDIYTEAEADYNAMCKRVYLSDTPIKDELFADWTEKDIAMLLAYNDEIAQLEKRNSEITVEYRDLDPDAMNENMIPLYNELVRNNNRIAEIYGYDNYYVYAYEMVYQRDYEPDMVQRMRQYTARYLGDACQLASERFDEVYYDLDYDQQTELSDLIYSAYDQLDENYVQLYIDSMPESSQEMMNDMLQRNRAVFTEYHNAYEGAFTTWIDGEPFCFFGPGYTGSETVIHELGHYYGSMYVEPWVQPMDLSESQSQGNEWMYIHFLKQKLTPEMYQAVSEYRMSSDIAYIIGFVMVDQFEEAVYCHENAGNLTLEEYDGLMEAVAENYGGIDWVAENVMDMQLYWKMVVLESPVYYISYAVSAIAAVNLFLIAEEDRAYAEQCYCILMEQTADTQGFMESISLAGLAGPFEETVYEKIYLRYGK